MASSPCPANGIARPRFLHNQAALQLPNYSRRSTTRQWSRTIPALVVRLNPDRGYGFEIAFDWTDVAAAVEYDLFAIHRGAPLPLVDTQVSGSDHTNTRCNSFVTDSNLDDWDWRVRARDAQGNTGNWSQTATFRFEPCRLAGGGSCSAPPPPPPPPSGPVTLFFQDTENPDQISTAGDMLSALVEFNLDTGAFQVTWTADPGNPFNGDLILNLNLGNLRLGGNLLMLSRTFSAVSSTTQLSYTGTNAALTSWLIGDEITTHGSSHRLIQVSTPAWLIRRYLAQQ